MFLKHMVQTIFVRPKIRIYQTTNIYAEVERQEKLRKEVQQILAETNKRK